MEAHLEPGQRVEMKTPAGFVVVGIITDVGPSRYPYVTTLVYEVTVPRPDDEPDSVWSEMPPESVKVI